MKISFVGTFPKGQRKVLEKKLKGFGTLLNGRLEHVEVEYRVDDEEAPLGATAAINVLRQYRDAALRIFPRFFVLDEEDQDKVLMHELMHVMTAPLRDEIYRLIDYWVSPDAQQYIFESFEEKEELFVDDMARFIVDNKLGKS